MSKESAKGETVGRTKCANRLLRTRGFASVLVAIVALAHPQEIGTDPDCLFRVGTNGFDDPSAVTFRPIGLEDLVTIANALC